MTQVSLISGLMILVLSLHFMGIIQIKFLYYEKRVQIQKRRFGPASSFFLGFFFAFGWTPCIGPVLTTILAMAAQQETANAGIVLLGFYSAGLALPFLATAIFLSTFLSFFKKVTKHFDVIETALGGVMLVAATWFIFSQLDTLFSATIPTVAAGIVVLTLVLFKSKLPVNAFKIIALVLVAAIAMGGLGLYFLAPNPQTEADGPLSIPFDDFSGTPVTLEKYAGKPILLNFFASWCAPCRKEIPELIEIYNKKAQGRFFIIGVNCDEDVSDGIDLVKKMNIPYPVVHGDVDDLKAFGERTALPTNIILDANGQKAIAFTGFPGETVLLEQIEKLIVQ
jgi:cytochrome c-type biogenesis protein